MKLYSRIITVPEARDHMTGKLIYTPYREYVYTDDIDRYNKRKRIKFAEDHIHSGEAFIPDKVIRIRLKN